MVRQLVWMTFCLATSALAQEMHLTGSGFSGLGLQPSASVAPQGTLAFGHSQLVAGAAPNTGHSFTLAAGLGFGLEATTRLVTQSLRCNLWIECPTYLRDMSQSVKWSVPHTWLAPMGISAAVGVSDFGGAATQFRSHYVVGEKQWDWLGLRLGYSWKGAQSTPLEGSFAALSLKPWEGVRVEFQHSAELSSVHAGYSLPIQSLGVMGSIAWNQRIGSSERIPSNWWSVSVGFPLDRSQWGSDKDDLRQGRGISTLAASSWRAQLDAHGFQRATFHKDADGVWLVDAPNDHYRWNDADAMAVLLRFAAAAWGDAAQPVRIQLRRQGLVVIQAQGDARCIRQWLTAGDLCESLRFATGLERAGLDALSPLKGELASAWSLPRFDLAVSPIIASAIGTEVGSFDGHAGLGWNATVSLWPGAHADWNYNKASGWMSKNMRPDGILAQYRIKDQLSRRMLHQLLPMPWASSITRISVGRGYGEWHGRHLESLWLSPSGVHRLGAIVGDFKGPARLDPLFGLPIAGEESPRRNYRLVNYRLALPRTHAVSTEVFVGRFWAGDEGYALYQRFRFGDASLAAFFRRSKMPQAEREVSFAGIQLAMPLTPRYSNGWKYFGVRGSEAWQYAIESKVLENDNYLTTGYGEIPRFGQHLALWMNQDRLSADYFDHQLPRMRKAASELSQF